LADRQTAEGQGRGAVVVAGEGDIRITGGRRQRAQGLHRAGGIVEAVEIQGATGHANGRTARAAEAVRDVSAGESVVVNVQSPASPEGDRIAGSHARGGEACLRAHGGKRVAGDTEGATIHIDVTVEGTGRIVDERRLAAEIAPEREVGSAGEGTIQEGWEIQGGDDGHGQGNIQRGDVGIGPSAVGVGDADFQRGTGSG